MENCPKGFELYSPICGSCEFYGIDGFFKHLVCVAHKDGSFYMFTKEGYLYDGYDDAECLLFPSKDQRDWSKFTTPWIKKEKFDPNTLMPFDKVLVRNSEIEKWRCAHFSYFNKGDECPYVTFISYRFCVPYNDDTKHLVGTVNEAPEYYKYWED